MSQNNGLVIFAISRGRSKQRVAPTERRRCAHSSDRRSNADRVQADRFAIGVAQGVIPTFIDDGRSLQPPRH